LNENISGLNTKKLYRGKQRNLAIHPDVNAVESARW
jgi:hypothetical protein